MLFRHSCLNLVTHLLKVLRHQMIAASDRAPIADGKSPIAP
jgi:hypothetical protein